MKNDGLTWLNQQLMEIWNGNMEWEYGMGIWNGNMEWEYGMGFNLIVI